MSLNKPRENRFFKLPNFVSWFYPRRIWRLAQSEQVFLTFDDGPHPEITPWLLGLLRENNIKASFFWLGENIRKYPHFIDEAISDGHTVGHHGLKHISPRKQSLLEFTDNFQGSENLVPHKLFRPPYGDLKRKQALYVLTKAHLVMWNWMSYDYDEKVSTTHIVKSLSRGIKKGDIIVFHENEKTTGRLKSIIPELITEIREKGFTFAALDKAINDKYSAP
ncbi:MAG: polysaccharide deacetylase family protein [Brumimicrobium sp.]|nr:polysaccharide deacetylase family protein [Brumimicrobium sp.]